MSSAVIVPVREATNMKLRLRGFLTESQRAELGAALLGVVLQAVDSSMVGKAVIVSSDPALFENRFTKKMTTIKESRYHGGVNRAMKDGLEFLKSTHRTIDRVLLVPSDLPLLRANDLDRTLDLLEKYEAVLNPSSKLDGTALLAFRGLHPIPLHYDDDSYRKHLMELKKSKLKYVITRRKGFSIDLDDLDDFRKLMNYFGVTRKESLIERLKRQVRIFD